MRYILALLAVGALFLALHYFTELDKKEKLTTVFVVFAIICGAIFYNSYQMANEKKILDVVLRFNQNKTLKCSGVDVNKTNFTLSVGTYTFIGKENTSHYGEMISASSCDKD